MIQDVRFTWSCPVYEPLAALPDRSSAQLVESSASWTQADCRMRTCWLRKSSCFFSILQFRLRLFAGLFQRTWCTVSSRRPPRPRVHGYRGRLHRRGRKRVGMDQRGAKAEFLVQLYFRRAHIRSVGSAVRLASATSSHSLVHVERSV